MLATLNDEWTIPVLNLLNKTSDDNVTLLVATGK